MTQRIFLSALGLLLLIGLAFAADETPAPAAPAPAEPAPQSTPAQAVELICPIDHQPISGWHIEAFATSGVDSDFCYLNASESYYQKLIATCPNDGYTGYEDDFLPLLKNPLPAKVVEKIKVKLPKEFDLKKLEPWDRYAILAQIYIWRGLPEKEIANAYLRATYTMRGLALGRNEKKMEKELRGQAIDYMEEAAAKAQFPLPDVPQVKYLIGDLYRRNGKFSKALRLYDDAAKMKNRPEWLDEMILRQKARAYAYDDR